MESSTTRIKELQCQINTLRKITSFDILAYQFDILKYLLDQYEKYLKEKYNIDKNNKLAKVIKYTLITTFDTIIKENTKILISGMVSSLPPEDAAKKLNVIESLKESELVETYLQKEKNKNEQIDI